MITQSELHTLLDYNYYTGVFRWRSTGKGRKSNAGWDHCNGYRVISILNERHFSHRLAWLYVFGKMPENFIDHIDMKKDNNSIFNLRDSSKSENMCNRPKQRNNQSPYKGVSLHRRTGKWRAHCTKNRVTTYLGLHDTPEQARDAYNAFASKAHGDFHNPS